MPNYTFEEIIDYFGKKMEIDPPLEDIQEGEVELIVDRFPIILSKGNFEGALSIRTVLGLYVQPFHEERLKDLATSNFFNINTGGCTLALDEVSIVLKCQTSPGTPPQENWEWLHRTLSVAREWHKVLSLWDEFIPLRSD